MFDQNLIQYFDSLYNPKKIVDGKEVDKTYEEIEAELNSVLLKDFGAIELSTAELKEIKIVYERVTAPEDLKDISIEELSAEEGEEKEALSIRAREIFTKGIIRKILSQHIVNQYLVPKGKSIDRKAYSLMTPLVDNMSLEEIRNSCKNFYQMTSDEKLSYFRTKITALEKCVQDLANCTSDKDVVNALDKRYNLINMIGELDISNNGIQCIREVFGVPITDEDINRIRKVREAGVDLATYSNQLGMIGSPYYSKYKDINSIGWLSSETMSFQDDCSPKVQAIFRCTSASKDLIDYKKDSGHFFSSFMQVGCNTGFVLAPGCIKNTIHSVLKTRSLNYSLPSFKTVNGTHLELSDAIAKLMKKEYVDVYDNNKFITRVKQNRNGYISEFEKPFKMDLKKGDAIILQTRLQEMKEALDSCNPKHVRFEASIHIGNSGKYQKVVDELDKLLKTDLSKPIEVEKSLKKISEGINDYLVEKTRDGKTKVELTNKREDVMLKAYNFFKPLADQNAVLLEAQVNTTEQLDFLDKVQTTILTDEPENAEDTVPFDDDKSTDAVIEKDI